MNALTARLRWYEEHYSTCNRWSLLQLAKELASENERLRREAAGRPARPPEPKTGGEIKEGAAHG